LRFCSGLAMLMVSSSTIGQGTLPRQPIFRAKIGTIGLFTDRQRDEQRDRQTNIQTRSIAISLPSTVSGAKIKPTARRGELQEFQYVIECDFTAATTRIVSTMERN